MPKYSIVIPVYNGAAYLAECAESILAQTEPDFELILVDDCSTDNSRDVIAALEKKDERIKSIFQETNGGTLVARKAGVAATQGSFVMLVDQDDGLVSDCLAKLNEALEAKPADMYHFGVDVIAETAAAKEARAGMLSYLTPEPRTLAGSDILAHQFAESDGFDWNVHHKLFAGELARKAWGAAAPERLTLSDDLYACFILCALAKTYVALPDSAWYTYHLGRGETLGASIDMDGFIKTCDRDYKAYELVQAYAQSAEAPERADWDSCLSDVRDRLIDHTMNEAKDKLDQAQWEQAFRYAYDVWPKDAATGELFRFVRDALYDDIQNGREPSAQTSALIELAKEFDKPLRGEGSARYQSMRKAALSHLRDLNIPRVDFYAPLKIFVTTHKAVDLPKGEHVYFPVQVGPKKERFSWASQDDTGENIAEKNPQYCELTTQYWAWKNSDADYFGFCHYRRYFVFSEEVHPENPWGEVIDDYIDENASWIYRLGDKEAAEAVEDYDIVTTGIKDLHDFPEAFETTFDHYKRAPYLKIKDLERVIEILKEQEPDYAEDADAYLAGSKTCFCNMYIMRKELFFAYCAWMFPLLERFCEGWDTELLSHETLRTPGHLSERLFNIWLMHQKRTNPELKHKELQCVHFEKPEHQVVKPLDAVVSEGAQAGKPVVPVVFAADNNYVPMVTTTVYSMLKNASSEYFYDVVILEKDFSAHNKEVMSSFFAQFDNAALRFLNVGGIMSAYNLQTSNEHISVETYYRFLIQQVLPDYDKVLYLDSDLIIKGDAAELFATELGDNLIAAARDIDYLGNLNMNDGERMDYTREVLGMENPYDYFQAGVLVLNTAAMRELHTVGEWLEIASEPKYIYDDQDILNAECQGRVVYLDNAWNVMNDCGGRIKKVFSFAPAAIYDKFLAAYAAPKIVHYAGFEKPWKPGPCDLADLYWSYARETPFYEALFVGKYADQYQVAEDITAAKDEVIYKLTVPPKAISEDSPLRNVFDGVLPQGSRRREVAKAAVRKIRGIK